MRIREIGAENNVPTLEAPPLRVRCIDMRRSVNKSRVNCTPGGGSAGLGLATETLASGWWKRPVQPTHLPVPEALDFINENRPMSNLAAMLRLPANLKSTNGRSLPDLF